MRAATTVRVRAGALAAVLLVAGHVGSGRSAQVVPDAVGEARRLRARGLDAGYNLDHAEALAAFAEAMRADPSDPAPHRLSAASLWIQMLFLQGAVLAEDYLGQARTQVARTAPPEAMTAAFRSHMDAALRLARDMVSRDPTDADAHFQLGATYSFLATYTATVEGRGLAGFRAARSAYREHQRVLELDPQRTDAGMVVGMYRYAVSTLPLHWRVLAAVSGFDGGRERGLRMIEAAASRPSDIQVNAQFALVVIYNREERYDDALRVIAGLQRRYPRNRLLWLEQASTCLRAGRAPDARLAAEQGMIMLAADNRPLAYGELARWRYTRGAALAAAGRAGEAERHLRAAIAVDGPEWLRGRAHAELGKLADAAGHKDVAVAEYSAAIRIGRAHNDPAGRDEAARRLRAASRR